MNKFTKVLIVEGAIAMVLLLIIAKMPSHKKHASVTSASLSYEHGALSIPMGNQSAENNGEGGTTNVDPSRPKGGMSSYEDGTYTTPDATPTPAGSKSDPGTTDPGTTDPGTTDPGTTDPGTTDPGTTDPGTTDPGTTDPGTTDPGTTDPGSAEPTKPPVQTTGQTAVVTELGAMLRVETNAADELNGMYYVGQGTELPVVSLSPESHDSQAWVEVLYLGDVLYIEAAYVEIH